MQINESTPYRWQIMIPGRAGEYIKLYDERYGANVIERGRAADFHFYHGMDSGTNQYGLDMTWLGVSLGVLGFQSGNLKQRALSAKMELEGGSSVFAILGLTRGQLKRIVQDPEWTKSKKNAVAETIRRQTKQYILQKIPQKGSSVKAETARRKKKGKGAPKKRNSGGTESTYLRPNPYVQIRQFISYLLPQINHPSERCLGRGRVQTTYRASIRTKRTRQSWETAACACRIHGRTSEWAATWRAFSTR